jgi:hypothetical protein
MKNLVKLTLLAATAAIFATASALADSPQLQNSLAIERAKAERTPQSSTVAVQVRGRGFGERVTTTRETEERGIVLHQGRGQTQVLKFGTR